MILVLVDHDRGTLDPLSTRALTAARGIDLIFKQLSSALQVQRLQLKLESLAQKFCML